ncbi:MAG: CapA family protein [Rhodobacteraceae bacterium]|nr:CapA family protein [Paracoccaceae bacterium]
MAFAVLLAGGASGTAFASAGEVCRPVASHPAALRPVCGPGQSLSIAAVGDVLLHSPLQRKGYADGFQAVWGAAIPYFRAADIAYANLEGPVAPGFTRSFRAGRDPGRVFDNSVYTSYPMFNYHPAVVDDLIASGIRVVSTANNHVLDRGGDGAEATLGILEARGLAFSGSRRRDAARTFVRHVAGKGSRVAWLACTFSTNGIPDPDRQVLMCYEDRDEMLALIRAEAARPDVAAIIVTPHWGVEYTHRPLERQRELARDIIAAGATAVIGTHPHVIQPWEYLPGPDGKDRLVIYSTGNFVSGQVSLAKQTSILAWIELCRVDGGGGDLGVAMSARFELAGAYWLPLLMRRGPDGPSLSVVGPDEGGSGGAARALIARLLPDAEMPGRLACAADSPVAVALQ